MNGTLALLLAPLGAGVVLALWNLRRDPEPRLALATLLLPALGLRHVLASPSLGGSLAELIETPYAAGLALEFGINCVAALTVLSLARSLRERNRAERVQWDSMEAVRALGAFLTERRGALADGMSELLALGCERLDLELGVYTRIDGDAVLVVAVEGPVDAPLKVGDAFALADTLCHATAESDAPLAVERVAGTHWAVHASHARMGIESYLGARVSVNGVTSGTLYFAGREPRRTRFTGVEKQIVGLMTDWLGGELERGQLAEAEATARSLAQENAELAARAEATARETAAREARASAEAEAARAMAPAANGSAGASARLVLRRGNAIDRRRLDLNAALQQLEPELRESAGDVRRLTLALAPDDPIVKLHRHEFDRVLWSLCWQALEATPADSTLRVAAATLPAAEGVSAAPYATLTVSSSGPGLDAQGVAALFEERGANAPIATREGRLSLPRVQRLLQSNAGDLSVHSDPSAGTTLTAYLPLAQATRPPHLDPAPLQ